MCKNKGTRAREVATNHVLAWGSTKHHHGACLLDARKRDSVHKAKKTQQAIDGATHLQELNNQQLCENEKKKDGRVGHFAKLQQGRVQRVIDKQEGVHKNPYQKKCANVRPRVRRRTYLQLVARFECKVRYAMRRYRRRKHVSSSLLRVYSPEVGFVVSIFM